MFCSLSLPTIDTAYKHKLKGGIPGIRVAPQVICKNCLKSASLHEFFWRFRLLLFCLKVLNHNKDIPQLSWSIWAKKFEQHSPMNCSKIGHSLFGRKISTPLCKQKFFCWTFEIRSRRPFRINPLFWNSVYLLLQGPWWGLTVRTLTLWGLLYWYTCS